MKTDLSIDESSVSTDVVSSDSYVSESASFEETMPLPLVRENEVYGRTSACTSTSPQNTETMEDFLESPK